jgi:kinesin family protein 4/21/27
VDVDPAALAGQIGSATANGIKKHPTFSFDHVLSEASKQTDVYAATGAEVIDDFIKGHNVTFLA